MNKSLLLILFFFTFLISQAQRTVVALPTALNIVYIGLDNPVQIAVEGYTREQLTVTCDNCTIIRATDYHILKVTTPGICKVIVSYKMKKSLKTDTLMFKVKYVPRTESMFGTIESGPAYSNELINQHTINAVLPNFYFKGIEFTVIKFAMLYLPKQGAAIPFSVQGNQIPFEIKRLIAYSNPGDKILVDDIMAVGPGGIDKRLAPIAITISGQTNKLLEITDFYTYKETENSKIDTIYGEYDFESSIKKEPIILKGYKNQCGETKLIMEVKRNTKNILWEKHYYPSGKLKAVYDFENNDTIGSAKSFYENGRLKSEGKLLVKNHSVSERYGDQFIYGGDGGDDINNQYLLDSFLFHNYSPFGPWKGYYETGKVALECTLSIYNYGKIPMKESDPEIYIYNGNNSNKKHTSIKEAFESKDSYFKPAFTGSFKLCDRDGKIIKEENF
ncbi:MAG: GldM family protein [Bacteroidia bacterium]